ncbi:MAG: GAF domain-containing protein [Methanosarcinales archaeon]
MAIVIVFVKKCKKCGLSAWPGYTIKEKLIRTSRILQSICEINQLIISEKYQRILFQQVCNILTKVNEYSMVWVGVIESDSKSVIPVASSGFEEGYLNNIKITWNDSDTGQGPTGMAIKNKKAYIMRNIGEMKL